MGRPVVPGWSGGCRAPFTRGKGCLCGEGSVNGGVPEGYGCGFRRCCFADIGGTETQGFGRGQLLFGAGTLEGAGSGRGHG